MSALTERLLRRFYLDRPGWRDGTAEFHDLVASRVPAAARILEIGAGAPNPTSRFLATLGEVHGVDPSPDVLRNDALASAAVVPDERLPFPDASFDACVSNWVVEHLRDPALHARELARVLKPGGRAFARTPNRWHYVALGASLTPHVVHRLVANRLRALPPGAPEPFPTLYRMNTPRAMRREARAAGLVVEELRLYEKEPSYGMIAAPLFLAGVAYERLVNSTGILAPFRAAIMLVLRR